jgi:hypothetical protein
MAEEHVGPRPAPWTKIFTGFKVALDLKKLLLAGAGVLVMALGWTVLSWAAYSFPGFATKPEWGKEYAGRAKTDEERRIFWIEFKARRASWNLLHELAGHGPVDVEPADVATTLPEYEALTELRDAYLRWKVDKIVVSIKDKENNLEVANKAYPFTIVADPKEILKDKKEFPLRDLNPEAAEQFQLGQGADVVTIKVTRNADELKKYRSEAGSVADLRARLPADPAKRAIYEKALVTLEQKLLPRESDGLAPQKPGGRLRALPWFEYRGENPYLVIVHAIKENSAEQAAQPVAVPHASVVAQLTEMVPVLLEPLVKILTPIVYLFHRDADWYVRIYLVLVLLFALAVWGFFGGAITRLAAVQIARNEKIPLREALVFAKDHFISFFAAPAFPLLLLAILVIALWLFGWFEGLIPIFGDIVLAGLLWPLVLIVGLIMAVVLVGLIGWPLMNPTISVEGSDSFDALSRSYSYVYQAIWHYLWYSVLALLYGMALVFFVGLMASLVIFLGKWAVGTTPGIGGADFKTDREPSYLFIWAPTSFGWRDLMIHNSRFAVPKRELTPSGLTVVHYEFTKDYTDSMRWYNYAGAALVSVWIYLFFLLVVGFGYSYFWTAATIIYFLMRRQVDDTDMDEVHLEEEESLDPFARPASPAAAAAAPAKSDKVSLSVVEPPALRTAISPGAPPPTAPFVAPSPAAPPIAPLASTPPPPAPPAPPVATPPPAAVEAPPPAAPDATGAPAPTQDHTEPPPGNP